jgi:Flp pilus assembly secretin CpaC
MTRTTALSGGATPVIATPVWRRAGGALALAASLAFAFSPTLVLAQALDTNAPAPLDPTPKAKPVAAKKKSRHMPSDTVSDDLNRREAERAEQLVRAMTAAPAAPGGPAAVTPLPVQAAAPVILPSVPPPAKLIGSEPPTVAAIPPRAPIVTASLTPDIPVNKAEPVVKVAPVTVDLAPDSPPKAKPTSLALPKLPAPAPAPTPLPKLVQTQAQATPPSAPAPVPVRPAPPTATPTTPPTPVVTTGAPSRAFAQSQVVPTQQPTLALEVNKGTAIKLPGPATTVFVAAPDIADVQVKSPGMIYVFAKKPGDTVLYAVDDQDHVLLNTIVSVSSPISRIKTSLDAIHPGNGIDFGNQGETIVLSGTARSAAIAEDARRLALQHVNGNANKVISNIRIDAPTQVQIRVKVAEIQRGALKRVGINWQNISNIAQFGVGGITIGGAVNTVQATGGTASGAIAATGANGGLTTFVDFLATQNMATVLAEPNLIAMSGETASFLAGGEIPVLSPQAGLTGSTVSVTYKQVGISLSFTPTIIGERINLKVAPEVSQVTTTGQVSVPLTATATVVIPAIETRRASTTVELGSGQSFAIAGLLQQSSQQDIQKLPWLGDVPILGALFKSDAYQRSETELVIIITPYLVEPTSTKLRTPFTDRVPPTDVDRILLGRTSHPTPPREIAVGREQRSAGPTAGFRLD